MTTDAVLKAGERELTLPVIVGTEGEHGIDVKKFRSATGYITLDPGYTEHRLV